MPFFDNYFRKTFFIDERSLILARILIFISIIWNFSNYYRNLYFLSPETGFSYTTHWPFFPLNIFNISNSYPFLNAVFIIGFLSSLLFLWGKWTKTSIVVIWLINASLRNQVDFESRAFETLIQITLIWFYFFPSQKLNRLWANKPTRIINGLAVFGLYSQIVLLYFFSFLHKLKNPKWVSLDALQFILINRNYQTSFSPALLSFPILLKGLTLFSLIIEGLVLCLLLKSFANFKLRNLVVAGYIFFHLIILLFVQVGIFTPISLALWCSLILWRPVEGTEETRLNEGPFKMVMVMIIFILSLWSNIQGLRPDYRTSFMHLLGGTGLVQRWAMFSQAQHTSPINLWLATKATFKDDPNQTWDVFNDRPVDFSSAPKKIKNGDYIWGAFITQIAFASQEKVQEKTRFLPTFLCKRWNSTRERKISSIEIKVIRNGIAPYQVVNAYPLETNIVSGQCP